VYIALQIVVSV